jgi:hypothetical protein
MSAALRSLLVDCCGEDTVDSAVGIVLAAGWTPPLRTLLTVAEVEDLPNGTPVIVGSLDPRKWPPAFGVKTDHAILFTGEEEPYPLHQEGLAPPLPCTVVWQPQDTTDFNQYADGSEQALARGLAAGPEGVN